MIPTPPSRSWSDQATSVLVPVKSFAEAKGRLSSVLTEQQRVSLMQRLTEGVITAAHPFDVAVVCDDVEVGAWAQTRGARVILTDHRGLNFAVRSGVDALAAFGYETVIIAHGDLIAPSGLASLPRDAEVVLVPDRHHDGTNVLIIPAMAPFDFSYGSGSFQAHLADALRRGLSVAVLEGHGLQHDVDEPDDLAGFDLESLTI
jgi:2-phospho-L-lactate guanylyltransferase